MKTNKGFTLIELLVVIAIIGILATVVLASLSSARAKGRDAAVKTQMKSLQTQADLYHSVRNWGDWDTVSVGYGCAGNPVVPLGGDPSVTGIHTVFNDPTVLKILQGIRNNTSADIMCKNIQSQGYAVFARLSDNTIWCVDGTYYAGTAAVMPVYGTPGIYKCN